MSRISVLIIGVSIAICGCDSAGTGTPAPSGTPTTTPPTPPKSEPVTPPLGAPPAADNSAVNERDRSPDAKTPIDQSEDAADIKITSDIRKRVMEQPKFSIDAQNIKIITADGKVTLRGPVKADSEKETIEKIAHDVAGEDNVDSQLEVTP